MARHSKKLYTLTDVSEKTGISMPTLMRYKKRHQYRIPSVGKGRRQRYPEEALDVFRELKQETAKRRGRPRGRRPAARKSTRPRKAAAAKELLTLKEVAERAGISYPTATKYAKQHAGRIPYEGSGRTRRYYSEAVEVFKQIRSETRPGRKPGGVGKRAPALREAQNLAAGLDRLERGQQRLAKAIDDVRRELSRPLTLRVGR